MNTSMLRTKHFIVVSTQNSLLYIILPRIMYHTVFIYLLFSVPRYYARFNIMYKSRMHDVVCCCSCGTESFHRVCKVGLFMRETLLRVAGRPGSSEVPRNPLTRCWDVSSIPANGIFLTKKTKKQNKNAQRVEND